MPDEPTTAYHEAGHAVMAHVLGKDFKTVSILPDGVGAGRIDFKAPVSERSLEMESIVAVAGVAAEGLATGRLRVILQETPSYLIIADDVHRLTSYLLQTGIVAEDNIPAFLQRAVMDAVKTLRANWPAVEAVAKALLKEKTISGSRARSIIAQFRGHHT